MEETEELKNIIIEILSCCDLSDDKSEFLLYENILKYYTTPENYNFINKKVANFMVLLNSAKRKSEDDLKEFLSKDFDKDIWGII